MVCDGSHWRCADPRKVDRRYQTALAHHFVLTSCTMVHALTVTTGEDSPRGRDLDDIHQRTMLMLALPAARARQ
jgi:hypothetical protein